jgi:hypothetical protein
MRSHLMDLPKELAVERREVGAELRDREEDRREALCKSGGWEGEAPRG